MTPSLPSLSAQSIPFCFGLLLYARVPRRWNAKNLSPFDQQTATSLGPVRSVDTALLLGNLLRIQNVMLQGVSKCEAYHGPRQQVECSTLAAKSATASNAMEVSLICRSSVIPLCGNVEIDDQIHLQAPRRASILILATLYTAVTSSYCYIAFELSET